MISARINRIKPSATVKIASMAVEMKEQGLDIIDFGAGEPDFQTPANIKEAAFAAIKADKTKYTANSGLLKLREAVSQKLQNDNGLDYSTDEIIISSGAKHSLYNVMMSILDPGDEVIIPAPYWTSYPEITKLAEAVPVIINTSADSNFRITPEQIALAVTDKTRVFILCNPCNPTGVFYSKTQLQEIAAQLMKKNIIIIADEIYEKLLYDNLDFTSFASLSPAVKEKTVIINGLSKAYAMTGWRIGYAAGPSEIIKAANKIQSHTTSAASSISQYAGIEALTGPQQAVNKMTAVFEKRRNLMYERLMEIPDISCVRSQGAFYLLPKFAAYYSSEKGNGGIKNSSDICRYFLEQAGVVAIPGAGFGADDFVRLSFAVSSDHIEEGMRRIKRALSQL